MNSINSSLFTFTVGDEKEKSRRNLSIPSAQNALRGLAAEFEGGFHTAPRLTAIDPFTLFKRTRAPPDPIWPLMLWPTY